MSQLPASASRLMHVLAETLDARLSALPVPGPDTLRPETAPESFVPFLAWGWSVDLWDADWPIERKRQITADALEMHRLKGTEAGIRRYLAYTNAQDVRFTVPPQDFFASAGPESDPAWRRWLASLPEIRLYQIRKPAILEAGIAVAGGEDILLPENAFLGAESPQEPTFFAGAGAAERDLEYAVIVQDDVHLPVNVERLIDRRIGMHGDVVSLFIPGDAGRGAFANDMACQGGVYLKGSPAQPGALKIALGPSVAPGHGWALVQEQAEYVQDVQPEAGMYEVISPIGLFADIDHAKDAILDTTDLAWGTYQAVRLIRPGITMPPAASYLDADRLGIGAYTAEIRLALPEKRSDFVMHAAAAFAGQIHAAPPTDLSDLQMALDAVEISQSCRDRLLVDLAIPPPKSLKATRRLSTLSL